MHSLSISKALSNWPAARSDSPNSSQGLGMAALGLVFQIRLEHAGGVCVVLPLQEDVAAFHN